MAEHRRVTTSTVWECCERTSSAGQNIFVIVDDQEMRHRGHSPIRLALEIVVLCAHGSDLFHANTIIARPAQTAECHLDLVGEPADTMHEQYFVLEVIIDRLSQ